MGPHSHLLLPPGPSSGCRPSDRGAPQLGMYIPRGSSSAQEITRLRYWLPHVEGPQGKLSPRGMGTIQGATRLQTAQGGQDGQPQLPLLIPVSSSTHCPTTGANWRDFHVLSVHPTRVSSHPQNNNDETSLNTTSGRFRHTPGATLPGLVFRACRH